MPQAFSTHMREQSTKAIWKCLPYFIHHNQENSDFRHANFKKNVTMQVGNSTLCTWNKENGIWQRPCCLSLMPSGCVVVWYSLQSEQPLITSLATPDHICHEHSLCPARPVTHELVRKPQPVGGDGQRSGRGVRATCCSGWMRLDTAFRMMESCGFAMLTVPLVDPLTKAWQKEMVLY